MTSESFTANPFTMSRDIYHTTVSLRVNVVCISCEAIHIERPATAGTSISREDRSRIGRSGANTSLAMWVVVLQHDQATCLNRLHMASCFIHSFSIVQQFDSVKGQRLHFCVWKHDSITHPRATPRAVRSLRNGTCVLKEGDVPLPTWAQKKHVF